MHTRSKAEKLTADGVWRGGWQIGVAFSAAERVCAKLGAAADSRQAIDMEEVFRLMTLQVIGEAVLSLPPEECDRVRPTGS